MAGIGRLSSDNESVIMKCYLRHVRPHVAVYPLDTGSWSRQAVSVGTWVAALRGFPSVGPAATKESRLLWVMHVPALQRKIREKASHAWDESACITPYDLLGSRAARRKQENGFEGGKKAGRFDILG